MPENERSPPRIPLRHLSVRVPWHDAGWDGTVCRSPRQNSSCLALNRIGATKNDAIEDRYAGQPLTDIPNEEAGGSRTARHRVPMALCRMPAKGSRCDPPAPSAPHRKRRSDETTHEAASSVSIADFRWRCLPAGNASAATGSACTDPTGAATAVAGSSVTRRRSNDRGSVLERVDVGGAALLVLRAGLHGHRAQQECRRGQSHRELSHYTLLLFVRLPKNKESTQQYRKLYAILDGGPTHLAHQAGGYQCLKTRRTTDARAGQCDETRPGNIQRAPKCGARTRKKRHHRNRGPLVGRGPDILTEIGGAGGGACTIPAGAFAGGHAWRSMVTRVRASPRSITTASSHVVHVQRSLPSSARSAVNLPLDVHESKGLAL
jgi:hypothetical protein